MPIRIPPASWDFRGFVFCFIFFSSFPGTILTQEVTLDSIQIFTTHDWFSTKPTVYFQCKGENKTVLPDVKRTNVSYSFNGEESWQPLTELNGTKCKRCGIYEDDTLKFDTFDEWELCPSDFTVEVATSASRRKNLMLLLSAMDAHKSELVKKILKISEKKDLVSVMWKICKSGDGSEVEEALRLGAFKKLVVMLQVGCGERTKEKVTELLKMMNKVMKMNGFVDRSDSSSIEFKHVKKPF